MGFAQRIGKKPSTKELQIESIDSDLRNGLWNTYSSLLIGQISGYRSYGTRSQLDDYFDFVWHEYYKLPTDQRYDSYDENLKIIRKKFFEYEWFDLYDFLEFNASWQVQRIANINLFQFTEECNRIFEREFAGYRFIENMIVPISNKIEVDEINEAINVGNSFFQSKYKGVNVHLKDALSKMSDKKYPDYRNSIKESISAVEALCRHMTNENTLGEALKKLEKDGLTLNSQFKAGIEKLYAYTNNKETGIRHALLDSPNLPTFDEAKFMLVTCSAFINFLISKSK